MIDVVFPKDNEDEFIAIAQNLGYDSIVFVYDTHHFPEEKPDRGFKVFYGLLCKTDEVKKARKRCDITLVHSHDRNVIEKVKPDAVYGFEEVAHKDFMHQRGSGINHVIAKIASEKKVKIAIPFQMITRSKRERAMLLGRVMQNIKLYRKYKVKTIIASFAEKPYQMRAPKDYIDFFGTLGMHPQEVKKSMNLF